MLIALVDTSRWYNVLRAMSDRSDDAPYFEVTSPWVRESDTLYTCAVVKHTNDEGFLITTYVTDVVKIGEVIWTR
jgi:hypothetical protein